MLGQQSLSVTLPTGEVVETSKCVSVNAWLESLELNLDAYVLNIEQSVILGADFLHAYGVKLDFAKRTAVLTVDASAYVIELDA